MFTQIFSIQTHESLSYSLTQGWANFLYGGPHLKKMLQPKAAHSHYKIGKFTLCVKKHIFILNTVFVFNTLVPWGGVPPS